MRFHRRNKRNILVIIISLTLILLFYHEKIINLYDSISLPINDEICKNLPIQIEERIKNFKLLKTSLVENLNKNVEKSKYRVAILVSYRDREKNLKLFLNYMHSFLREQNIFFGIYLIEPIGDLLFNRAQLLNIGFREALRDKNKKWNCFIFHDIDLLPENKLNLYECHDEVPKQMAITVSNYNYTSTGYFKEKNFGGVNAFTKEQFIKINGFSNMYFEWGVEDDDARLRVLKNFPRIERVSADVGRYFANCHEKQKKNPNRFLLYLRASGRVSTDGLNSLKYDIINIERTKLFTRIFVSYDDNRQK